jgi:hypothetical protein
MTDAQAQATDILLKRQSHFITRDALHDVGMDDDADALLSI